LSAACGAGVTSGQERSATRRANRALTIGARKRHPIPNQTVCVGGVDAVITQCTHRVIALLIGADPENVWAFCHAEKTSY